MPELFGICENGPLAEGGARAFEAMETDLLAFRKGDVSRVELRTARVGAISRHEFDGVAVYDDPLFSAVWIGAAAKLTQAEATELANAVSAQDQTPLAALSSRSAGFIHEKKSGTSWLVSDRYGHCPLYYTESGETLAFCTKFFPLFRAGLAEWRWNPVALIDLVTFEHVTGDETLSKGVRLLPPGTVLRFRDGRRDLATYWRPRFEPAQRKTKDAVDRLYEALVESTRECVHDSDRVAVTLSGGLDSRALLHCAHHVGARVRTYTFGLPGCRDEVIARQLAEKLDLAHTFVAADGSHLDRWLDHAVYVTGGMVGAIHFHIMTLADALTQAGESVVLDGLGGDALSGPMLKPKMLMARSAEQIAALVHRQRTTAWRSVEDILHPDILAFTAYRSLDAVRRLSMAGDIDRAWRLDHKFELLERQRRFNQYGPQLLEPFLAVRAPFYGSAVYETCLALGPWQQFEQRAYLSMQRGRMRSLAVVPDTLRNIPLTYPLVVRFGKKVLDAFVRRAPRLVRSRMTGTPPTTEYRPWLRQRLNGVIGERLREGCRLLDGVLQVSECERVVDAHLKGEADHGTRLGVLLALVGCKQLATRTESRK